MKGSFGGIHAWIGGQKWGKKGGQTSQLEFVGRTLFRNQVVRIKEIL
jgi:hypothetical protein